MLEIWAGCFSTPKHLLVYSLAVNGYIMFVVSSFVYVLQNLMVHNKAATLKALTVHLTSIPHAHALN